MVWRTLAEQLLEHGDGLGDLYAFDRRGHGRSSKPEPFAPSGDHPADASRSGYSFDIFADDLITQLDALGLKDVYAIGHSGGASELLIVAAQRPDLISRVIAVEPIIAPPTENNANSPNAMSEGAAKRRAEFDSAQAVIDRFGSRPPFDSWDPAILRDYVDYGFEALPDGRVRLLCPPKIESAMFASGGEHDILAVLPDATCPVLIISGERSGPQFAMMAQWANERLPNSETETFAGTTHFVPMEACAQLVDRIRTFSKKS
jgi:pimeloyl-ACP methyl ester carboxylesterase